MAAKRFYRWGQEEHEKRKLIRLKICYSQMQLIQCRQTVNVLQHEALGLEPDYNWTEKTIKYSQIKN